MAEPLTESVSPWMPEQDQIRLAALGKLIEELNEASSRAARCIIQGLTEIDPDTGRSNRAELSRELADVEACIRIAYGLNLFDVLSERVSLKYEHFRRWHDLIKEGQK